MRKKIDVQKLGTFTGHKDSLYTVIAGPRPNTFFTAGGDGLVVLWDLDKPNEGELVAKMDGTIYALCYIPAYNALIIGQNADGIRHVNLDDKENQRSLHLTKKAMFNIVFADDILYVATEEGVLIAVDFMSFQVLFKLPLSSMSLRSLVLNSNKSQLAVGASDHQVYLLDIQEKKVVGELKGHEKSVFALAFNPFEEGLITAGRDARIKYWDGNGTEQHDIVGHMFAIHDLSLRADGQYFATCSMDKSVKIWHTKDKKLVKVIDRARHAGHGTSVNKVIWLNKDTVVSVSDDRTISVWQLSGLED